MREVTKLFYDLVLRQILPELLYPNFHSFALS